MKMIRLICEAEDCTANEDGECALDSITIDAYGCCNELEDKES